MNWLTILNYGLMTIFGFVSLILIGIVLIQKGKGGGLASAFGGGSGTATAFGSKTGDVLTWATSVIFGVFLLLAVSLNFIANQQSKHNRAARMPAAPTTQTAPTGPILPPAPPPAPPPALPSIPTPAPAPVLPPSTQP
jgi:preprotein translocase subunit SecG